MVVGVKWAFKGLITPTTTGQQITMIPPDPTTTPSRILHKMHPSTLQAFNAAATLNDGCKPEPGSIKTSQRLRRLLQSDIGALLFGPREPPR